MQNMNRNKDTSLSSWDPMAADFNDKKFNSYLQGPGKTLAAQVDGRKKFENVRLHFNNVPFDMKKNGLVAICEKVQPGVLRAGVFTNKVTGNTWAIIEYASEREAQKVLLALDKEPPLNMRISFGKCIEARVNEVSIREHNNILRKQKEEYHNRHSISAEHDFKDFSSCFPKIKIADEVRQDLLEFSEDNFFNWNFQTGRGIILPPRQLYLSASLGPILPAVEHYRATLCLDQNGNRDQELDCFGHFSASFSEETTIVMEMIYEKYRSKIGNCPKRIYGGRAYDLALPDVVNVSAAGKDCFEALPSLESITVGEDCLIQTDEMKKIGEEGRFSHCSVCKKLTPNCCSTCLTPLCSASCAGMQGNQHIDQKCGPHDVPVEVYPLFRRKRAVSRFQDNLSLDKNKEPILNFGKNYNNNAPCSIIDYYSAKEQSAILVVQDIVTHFDEPQGFTCIIRTADTEVKSTFKKLRLLHHGMSEESSAPVLIEVEPKLAVGELNCAPYAGRQCRVLLKERDQRGDWKCIFIDRGDISEIPEQKISALSPSFSSIPRLSLFATVSHYQTSFTNLWTKAIQPMKKLRLHQMQILEGGSKISAKLINDEGVELCSVMISDWLPVKPNFTPLDSVKINDRDKVIISTFCSSNMCFVQILDRYEQRCTLQNKVNLLAFTGTPVTELPWAGSIVAVKSAVDNKFYRAMVKTQTSAQSTVVFYIDYGNREEVKINQIFPLPDNVANLPAEAVLVHLSEVPQKPLNFSAYMIFAKLVEDATTLEVQLGTKDNLVSLVSTSTNASVNFSLREALCGIPSSAKSEGDAEFFEKYCSNDSLHPAAQLPLKEGNLEELLVLHIFKEDATITVVPAYSPLLRHVLETQVREAAKSVAESEDGSYAPCANEVCIAKFKDDLWYRAQHLRSGKEWCDVVFTDIGDVGRVSIENLRKMPASLNMCPSLVTLATLSGVVKEDFANPQFGTSLFSVLKPMEKFEALVIKQGEGRAEIYIPKVIEKLVKAGLVPEARVAEFENRLPTSKRMQQDQVSCVTPNDILVDISADSEYSSPCKSEEVRMNIFDDVMYLDVPSLL